MPFDTSNPPVGARASVDRDLFSRVVAMNNNKGGVLKTSLATNMAGLLAEGDMRVLMVDLDPQGDTSVELGCKTQARDGQVLFEAIRDARPLQPAEFIAARANLDLIGGGEALEELQFAGYDKQACFDLLLPVFGPWIEDYDLVLIDTPPSSLVYIYAALGISRYLLMPTRSDVASIDRMAKAIKTMNTAMDYNDTLEPIGVVLTGVGRGSKEVRKLATQRIEAMGLGEYLFAHAISTSEATAQAARQQAKLVHELADDVIDGQARVKAMLSKREKGAPLQFPRLLKSAEALKGDYLGVANELVDRIMAIEEAEQA